MFLGGFASCCSRPKRLPGAESRVLHEDLFCWGRSCIQVGIFQCSQFQCILRHREQVAGCHPLCFPKGKCCRAKGSAPAQRRLWGDPCSAWACGPGKQREPGICSLFWGCLLWGQGRLIPWDWWGRTAEGQGAQAARGSSRSPALIKSIYLLRRNRILPAASPDNGELHWLSSPFPIKSFLV